MATAKGYRKMAKHLDGGYVAEQGYFDGDAVLKVLEIHGARRSPDGADVIWASADYEVSVPGANPPVEPVKIVRNENGTYNVPGKAEKIGRNDAIKIALGRMEPPALRQAAGFRGRRPVPNPTASRRGVDAGSTAPTTNGGPEVKAEPQENWTLSHGDRIMRHLALYPDGVDAQTMAAGMHDMASNKIRPHLMRLTKNNGPVVLVSKGVFKRRPQN